MSINEKINGSVYKEMILSGANWLEQKRAEVDRLNVFPVPDGDTGTNMAMTMRSSAKFVMERAKSDAVSELSQQAAYGALMGARGNSGVILSQILSGFAGALSGKEAIDSEDLKTAFAAGADAAYKAVATPMEGTVLTIVREASEALSSAPKHLSPEEILSLYIRAGYESLNRTPELLPVLKQAGVVDAGAQGFLFIMEGFLAALSGKPVGAVHEEAPPTDDLNDQFDHFFSDPEAIVYPYCTEFLIYAKGHDIQSVISQVKEHLSHCGDCMLVVGAGDVVKVHIHTNNLGSVLGFVSQYGELNDIKINNMREQNRELQSQGAIEEKEWAVVTVSNGDGFASIFKGLGATDVIYGGQTMNPSTQDFVECIQQSGAKKVILLPNNKNIIMAAEQAAQLCDDLSVQVVPSRTVPQGIQALMAFSPDAEFEDNCSAMTNAMADVVTGEITNAVRDTNIDGIDISEGAFMAIQDGKIISSVSTISDALTILVASMIDKGYELVTVYYGQDILESDAMASIDLLQKSYPDVEFECYEGGQLVYPFILSAE